MDGLATFPTRRNTNFDDLCDDCLVKILSLIGNRNGTVTPKYDRWAKFNGFPDSDNESDYQCPSYRDIRASHPLHGALVCKRWQSCAQQAVHFIQLHSDYFSCHMDLPEQLNNLTGLRDLRLIENIPIPFLSKLARATPRLEHLHIERRFPPRDQGWDFLRPWTCIKVLRLKVLYYNVRRHMDLVVILSSMKSVKRLSLMYGRLEPAAIWESLQPEMTQLETLGLLCNKLPPPYMLRHIFELNLYGFYATNLPSAFASLTALEILRLENCRLRRLPSSLGQLKALKVLEIVGCEDLIHLPDSIGDLQSLQMFQMTSDITQNLCKIPDSFSRLMNLERLDLRRLHRLRSLPEGLGELCRLKELQLEGFWNPTKESRIQESRSTRLMELQSDALCNPIPESVSAWLEELELEGFWNPIPESITALTTLTWLKLRDRQGDLYEDWEWSFLQRRLPESFLSLRFLQELRLEDLRGMASLPDSLSQLRSLQLLKIDGCSELSSLPETLGFLLSLRCFTMVSTKVSSLPESVSMLSSLRELYLEDCSSFEMLPDGLAQLTGLSELQIKDCEYFIDGMDVITRLKGLRYLGLIGCDHAKDLPLGWQNLTVLQWFRRSSVFEQTHADPWSDVEDEDDVCNENAEHYEDEDYVNKARERKL